MLSFHFFYLLFVFFASCLWDAFQYEVFKSAWSDDVLVIVWFPLLDNGEKVIIDSDKFVNLLGYFYAATCSVFKVFRQQPFSITWNHLWPPCFFLFLSFFWGGYYNMQYKLHLKQDKQGTSKVLNNIYKQ